MEPKWAEENLQTIRTLMERSALYRRALAPVMTFCGITGIVGGIIGWQLKINSCRGFVLFWLVVATAASVGAFVLVRRQAIKDSEPFWSPPTKRVTQALIPPFAIGAFLAALFAYGNAGAEDFGFILILIWCWAFGCGIHSAGFFMPRGARLFGWVFILAGFFLLAGFKSECLFHSPHLLMAVIFGGLHLAYGIYLYFTEPKTPVA